MTAVDVVVVGGGVIGCAVARRAARGGLSVCVLERGRPGAEASHAAAGMLSPLAEASGPGVFLDLLIRARTEYPPFVDALRGETGMDVAYDGTGTLYLALREEDDGELVERLHWQSAAGMCVQRLTAEETLSLEPAVTPDVRWALRFPGDHQVDNRRLGAALWKAAEQAGAEFRLGAEAVAIRRDGERVLGVELADGTSIACDTVVVAGGSWAGQVRGLPRALPVEPVMGQLLALQTAPPPFRHVVDSARCYTVPRADGRLIVGATTEHVGHRKTVTAGGVSRLLSGALEVCPALADAPIAETWAGLRPGTSDGLPILGRDPDVPGIIYATGHYRNGILLAPITGEIIGGLLLGDPPSIDIAPFSISRF
jgi:glycine oxidase